MENHTPQSVPHATAEPYCFLCHKILPKWPGRAITPRNKYDEWEHELVAVYALNSVVFAARITLPGRGTNYHHWPRLENHHVKLCWHGHDCSDHHLQEPLYTAHQDCWSVARKLHASISSLFLAAQSRRQIFPLQYSTRPDVRTFFPDRGQGEPALGGILGAVARRLPVELQIEVSRYLQGHLVASLLTASLATPTPDEVARWSACKTPSWESITSAGLGDKLHVNTAWILGLEYITDVGLGREGVPTTNLRGIRFALDTFGIRAIRVLYNDRSMSPWLGDAQFSWYGEVHGSDLGQLKVIRDVRRIIRIGFGPDTPQPPQALPRRLWSRESALDTRFSYTAADLEGYEKPPLLPFYPGWSLYPYIPFGNDGEYMSGLTVYCSPGFSFGVVTHGSDTHRRSGPVGEGSISTDTLRKRQSMGSRDGLPLHIALKPGERVVSVWACTEGPSSNPSMTGPFILVTTSLGRSYFLGPYYLLARGEVTHLTQLVKEKALVLGLSLLDGSAIGVAWKPSPNSPRLAAQPATIARPDNWPPIATGMQVAGVFLTTASLLDTRRLQVRRDGDRCVGLLVHHDDGSMDALGSWDPDDAHGITTIFEASDDGPLTSIAFRVTDFRRFYRVTDIIVGAGGSSGTPGGCRIMPVTTIAWWFSKLYDDVVEWQGRMVPVEEASPLSTATIDQALA